MVKKKEKDTPLSEKEKIRHVCIYIPVKCNIRHISLGQVQMGDVGTKTENLTHLKRRQTYRISDVTENGDFTVENEGGGTLTHHLARDCGTVCQNNGLDRWAHGWQQVVDNPVQEPLLSLSCANG